MPDRLYFTESDEATALMAFAPMALLLGFDLPVRLEPDEEVRISSTSIDPPAQSINSTMSQPTRDSCAERRWRVERADAVREEAGEVWDRAKNAKPASVEEQAPHRKLVPSISSSVRLRRCSSSDATAGWVAGVTPARRGRGRRVGTSRG
jgi:hypothetical protein